MPTLAQFRYFFQTNYLNSEVEPRLPCPAIYLLDLPGLPPAVLNYMLAEQCH